MHEPQDHERELDEREEEQERDEDLLETSTCVSAMLA
jgi:hypothetical protein